MGIRDRNSSMTKSALSGMFTLVISLLSALLLALVCGTVAHWLRSLVLIATLIGCAFVCALLLGASGLNRRPTRTCLRRAG